MKYLLLICLSGIAIGLNAQPDHYKNLVLEGGSIRGIAYSGAVYVLDSAGYLSEIENIAGTSAGAVQAMMLAMGYSGDEMKNYMSNLKWEAFNDGSYLFPVGMKRFITHYGWYHGEVLRNWCEDRVYEKTGIHNLTFYQLDSMRKSGSKYRNLIVFASNISKQQIEELSARTYPNLTIADAVYGSSAIPLYFEPLALNSNGHRIDLNQADSTTQLLTDGGLLANYPFFVFDTFPGKTLGIQLMRPEKLLMRETSTNTVPVRNVLEFMESCYEAILENQYNRFISAEMEENTIKISVGDIGPRIRKMKDEEVEMLVNNGKKAARYFISQKHLETD